MQTKETLMNETRIRVYANGGYAKNMIKSIKAVERLKIPPDVGKAS